MVVNMGLISWVIFLGGVVGLLRGNKRVLNALLSFEIIILGLLSQIRF